MFLNGAAETQQKRNVSNRCTIIMTQVKWHRSKWNDKNVTGKNATGKNGTGKNDTSGKIGMLYRTYGL